MKEDRVLKFCGNVFVGTLVVSVLSGIVLLRFGKIGAGVGCGFISILSMLAGMLMAFLKERYGQPEEPEEPELSEEESIKNEMISCKGMALSVSRVVAGRVTDRIISRMSGLHNKEQREAIFGDVDKIVQEEMVAIESAMEDQISAV